MHSIVPSLFPSKIQDLKSKSSNEVKPIKQRQDIEIIITPRPNDISRCFTILHGNSAITLPTCPLHNATQGRQCLCSRQERGLTVVPSRELQVARYALAYGNDNIAGLCDKRRIFVFHIEGMGRLPVSWVGG